MDEHTFILLRKRLGDDYIGKRMRAQVNRVINLSGQGRAWFHIENLPMFEQIIDFSLRISGLKERGKQNALQFVVRENQVSIQDLPPAFSGLRILQLSDLHLDGYSGLGALIAQAINGNTFDVCVLTGDFRFLDTGIYNQLITELEALVPALTCPFGVYGILGNHDYFEMIPLLEEAGIQLLINENIVLSMEEEQLWLVGLDDAHYYGLHDFEKAIKGIPDKDKKILLSHSPELIPLAADYGFDLYLSGHTHGGQFCLPGGIPIIYNARCERKYAARQWQYQNMSGYTSMGVGSSGVFARFFCPPEITIHVLQRVDD